MAAGNRHQRQTVRHVDETREERPMIEHTFIPHHEDPDICAFCLLYRVDHRDGREWWNVPGGKDPCRIF